MIQISYMNMMRVPGGTAASAVLAGFGVKEESP